MENVNYINIVDVIRNPVFRGVKLANEIFAVYSMSFISKAS